jgi:HEAT repeat protein
MPALRMALRDREVSVSVEAAVALWRVDGQPRTAVPFLLNLLEDKDGPGRWQAVRGLGAVGAETRTPIPELTKALVEALKDKDARVRVHAVQALWRIDRQVPVVVPLLRDAVKDRVALVRLTAVETLGELGPEAKAGPLLLDALKDKDPAVREAAVEALRRTGPEGVPLLAKALAHESPAVRAGAADALGRIGPPALAASKALAEAARDKDDPVRQAAARALRSVRPDGGEDVLKLIEILEKIEKEEKEKK